MDPSSSTSERNEPVDGQNEAEITEKKFDEEDTMFQCRRESGKRRKYYRFFIMFKFEFYITYLKCTKFGVYKIWRLANIRFLARN